VWYRVFGGNDTEPAPADLLAELRRLGDTAPVRYHGDDQGWFRVVLTDSDGEVLLEIDRYLSSEEGIRNELNTWAAWVETTPDGSHQAALMERIITARQVFTLHSLADAEADIGLEETWEAVCRYLARTTDGVYQIDGRGFFTAAGTLLVAENR
jgi:hypothetical protein